MRKSVVRPSHLLAHRLLIGPLFPTRSILLQDPDLFRPFEITQMCNLLPATAEEARSLIPSSVLALSSQS